MSDEPELRRITEICLALPEATSDDQHPPHRGFKVIQKNFAWYTVNEHGSEMVTLVVRTSLEEAEALVVADPERFVRPKYVARFGWVSYRLDLAERRPDWAEVRELVTESYRMQAPKRLSNLLD
ncbi:MAG: MmcQ/YjbR family DNA-binding protein [Acidimicrobiales bacterium]